MTITLNGTTGITLPNGSASAPAATGSDTDTGIVYGTNTVQIATGGTTAVTVNSSQNVGIGTTTPDALLHVYQTSGKVATFGNNVNNNGTYVVLAGSSSNKNWAIANNMILGGALEFVQTSTTGGTTIGATQAMLIDSSNYVGIGTSSPSSRLHVEKNDGGDIDLFTAKRTADNTGAIHRIIAGATTPSYLFYIVAQLSGGTVKFQVAGNGNVTNANNSYGGISDIKLKENIVDATPKLEDLCKVKIRQYNLKSEPKNKQIGVVAQELEEVFAGLVEETIDTDANGNNLGTTTKSVKYSVFVPMLIKAIQEQQAIISDLKARIETLENK